MAAEVLAEGKRLKAYNNAEPMEEVADEGFGDAANDDNELYEGLARRVYPVLD
jgi:hypothetical protein